MREVLQDVYDVPGLVALMRSVAAREVRVVEVETQVPSPFARSLLFGYVAQYLYEGDSPLAERRAAALTPRLHAARRAARAGRAARPARPRVAGPGRVRAAAAHPRASRHGRRDHGRPAAPARAAHARCCRDPRGRAWLADRARRRAPRHRRTPGRGRGLRRGRGRRPPARRPGHRAPGRTAGRLPRAGGRPGGRPRVSLRPNPRALPGRRPLLQRSVSARPSCSGALARLAARAGW